jgi:hypothetical protein
MNGDFGLPDLFTINHPYRRMIARRRILLCVVPLVMPMVVP